MQHIGKKIAWASCIGMFLVLLMGTLVTKTDSGRGCGEDWPLCNGKFIPAYTIESLIEYSHRFVTGIEGLLVVAVFVWVWLKFKHCDARWYASSALLFTIIQAILGALAVKWPQSSKVLALHFGFSLLAFSSTLLLALSVDAAKGPIGVIKQQLAGRLTLPSALFRWAVWGITLYCYVVVYLGAYVRHSKSTGGCAGWPLCNGQFVPELTGATGIVFIHRLAALLLFGLIAVLAYAARSYPIARRGCTTAFYFVVLQVFSGAFVTEAIHSDWYLLASMLHTVIIACLFGTLCYICVQMLSFRKRGNDHVAS